MAFNITEEQGIELYEQSLRPPLQAEESVHVLSDMERDSALWLKMRKFLEQSLASYREQNDIPQTELETAKIRGKIELVKEFLALGEVPGPEDYPDSPGLGY